MLIPTDKDKETHVAAHAPSLRAEEVASGDPEAVHGDIVPSMGKWLDVLNKIPGMESRGIERVPEEARLPKKVTAGTYVQMFLIWFSINCAANNMTVGILGPVAFGLGFRDSVLCALFGTLFGSLCTGYVSTFGPLSGLRTLIVARYAMGYWPSRLCVVLNIVIELGYGLVDSLVAGLMLSAVSGYSISVVAGIVVSSLITWAVAVFGIAWFHRFECYVWFPTLLMLFVMVGCAGPDFDAAAQPSTTRPAASRASYFFLAASGPLGWAPASADFYPYHPSQTPRGPTALVTGLGIACGKLLVEFLGIGLASGLASVPAWATALEQHSPGALIVEAYAPLGGFGRFCAAVLALCVAANNIPGTYAAGLNAQMLGGWCARVPRALWSTLAVVAYTVTAVAGRARLFDIFLNFLGLIGYWVIIWIVIVAEDEFLFRRRRGNGYDWDRWADKAYLPAGWAALAAFLIGWAGAIVSMSQAYYVGPIAALGNGADIGLPVGMAWAAISYPGLRLVEIKYVGR